MPMRYEILSDHLLLFVDFSGILLAHELRNQCGDVLQTLPQEALGGVIIETKNGTAQDLDVQEIKTLILESGRSERLPRGCRVAVVAKQDLSYGIGRIMQAMALSADLELRVFRSKVEALFFVLSGGEQSSDSRFSPPETPPFPSIA